MAKSSRSKRSGQRAITAGKIKKLQRAGLISAKIDPYKKPSTITLNKISKYRSVISGKQAAVRLSSSKKAAELRKRIGEGGAGRVVIVSREKGEKFTVTKKDEIHSTRNQYGQKIHKTIGDKFSPPKAGEKVYYTLPRRKRGLGQLKRRTFASFDELLFYLTKYEVNFDEIEDYIEVEKFKDGSRKQKQVQREYNEARAKLLKKRRRSRSRNK